MQRQVNISLSLGTDQPAVMGDYWLVLIRSHTVRLNGIKIELQCMENAATTLVYFILSPNSYYMPVA